MTAALIVEQFLVGTDYDVVEPTVAWNTFSTAGSTCELYIAEIVALNVPASFAIEVTDVPTPAAGQNGCGHKAGGCEQPRKQFTFV